REAKLAEAHSAAEGIRRQAREIASARRDEALRKLEADLAGLAVRDRERAENEARKRAMSAREALVDEVLQGMYEELERMADEPGFDAVVKGLLSEILREAPADAILMVPARYEQNARGWLAMQGRPSMAVEAVDGLRDGVALRDPRGRYRVSNRLALRLAKVESEARKRIAAALFGKES
ncbi:MAG: V-type ATP synthase subunit E, partial [FCB group bacterium]|nr:V-type ATP synthase subunit E [FCB group bacterium]